MSSNARHTAGFWKRTPACTPSIVDAAFSFSDALDEEHVFGREQRTAGSVQQTKIKVDEVMSATQQQSQSPSLLEPTPSNRVSLDKPPVQQTQAQQSSMSASNVGNQSESKFQSVLLASNTDIEQLRKLSWKGIPSECRAEAWRLLMGYVPINSSRRAATLQRKRKEYGDWRAQTFAKGEEALDRTLWHQIRIDVPRTTPGSTVFQEPRMQRSLERVLYCWAARHPASGYVQGINDLVTPFYHVFLKEYMKSGQSFEDVADLSLDSVEADSFWCLTKLLDGIQDNYTHAQPGIQRQIVKMRELVARIDGKLAAHLDAENVEFIQFAFRWINCLLMREVSLENTVRMWDTYLAEDQGFAKFHIYVCAALLLKWSADLRAMDFQQIMIFLQRPPTLSWSTKEIEILLSEAYMYKCLYDDSPSHYSGGRPQA
ncbi:GTPase-activating protein [Coemansia sp. RSA 1721]|nr:GTPase-activating protein [Coemansia sp. RSA 1721]